MAKQAPKKTAAKAAAKPRTAADIVRGTPRKLTRAQLIDELNNDLAKEFQALVQYVQHAAAMSGPQYDAIKAELVVHSNEEHAHAIPPPTRSTSSAACPASMWPRLTSRPTPR